MPLWIVTRSLIHPKPTSLNITFVRTIVFTGLAVAGITSPAPAMLLGDVTLHVCALLHELHFVTTGGAVHVRVSFGLDPGGVPVQPAGSVGTVRDCVPFTQGPQALGVPHDVHATGGGPVVDPLPPSSVHEGLVAARSNEPAGWPSLPANK